MLKTRKFSTLKGKEHRARGREGGGGMSDEAIWEQGARVEAVFSSSINQDLVSGIEVGSLVELPSLGPDRAALILSKVTPIEC